MKIISKIPGDSYLIKVTGYELGNILGEYSDSSLPSGLINSAISTEKDLKISDIYEKHNLIVDIQKSSDYDKARRKLENMLKALTPIENKLNLIPIEIKKS